MTMISFTMRTSVVALLLLLGVAAGEVADIFFYNSKSGESTATRPEAMPIFDKESQQSYWVVDGVATWDPPELYAWRKHATPDGNEYYENFKTQEVSWEAPEAAAWTARSSKRFFWHNEVTKESQWEKPAVLGLESSEHNATYFEQEGEATWEPPHDAKWTKHASEEGHTFFHHPDTDETTWEVPRKSAYAWRREYDVEML